MLILEKVGAGCIAIDLDWSDIRCPKVRDFALLVCPVSGRQTVPRSELTAGIHAVKQIRKADSPSSVLVDATYLLNGAQKRGSARDGLQQGSNADLWQELWPLLDANPDFVDWRKVKSHQQLEGLASELEDPSQPNAAVDALLNHCADAVAAVASRRCQLPDAALGDVSRWYGILVRIARRLVAVERHLQDAAPKVLPTPVFAPVPVGASAMQVAQSWRRKAAEQKHLVW